MRNSILSKHIYHLFVVEKKKEPNEKRENNSCNRIKPSIQQIEKFEIFFC